MATRYEHTQKGGVWLIVFVFLLLANFLLAGIALSLPSAGAKYFVIFLCFLFFGFLLWAFISMSSLTITIDSTCIRLCFGPGTCKKSFPLDQIAECKASRNPQPLACGIHWVFTGWLYLVAGKDVVELTFKNGRKAYVGTDQPEKLCQAIQQALHN